MRSGGALVHEDIRSGTLQGQEEDASLYHIDHAKTESSFLCLDSDHETQDPELALNRSDVMLQARVRLGPLRLALG